MSIPLLDKELWEDYADDEQEEAYDMLQDLKAQCDAKPTMLYINEHEKLHFLNHFYFVYIPISIFPKIYS